MIRLSMVRTAYEERIGDVPGTSMRLNSASTLVLVEGRMSPNWARFARCPTILMRCFANLKLENKQEVFFSADTYYSRVK
jgi:hypothetical protein